MIMQFVNTDIQSATFHVQFAIIYFCTHFRKLNAEYSLIDRLSVDGNFVLYTVYISVYIVNLAVQGGLLFLQ